MSKSERNGNIKEMNGDGDAGSNQSMGRTRDKNTISCNPGTFPDLYSLSRQNIIKMLPKVCSRTAWRSKKRAKKGENR